MILKKVEKIKKIKKKAMEDDQIESIQIGSHHIGHQTNRESNITHHFILQLTTKRKKKGPHQEIP